MKSNLIEKYHKIWKYDECVNGQYVIPKSECDSEMIKLILDFLSDHSVKFGGHNEYMLLSTKQPFYDENNTEKWVDCWVISDEYTY